MKRIHSIYQYLLAWGLVLMASQSLQAQEAFYIYRNDGGFDGFFFDEVKNISYSKYDLDSLEHDVYVVQDIELTDTIYRIPLAAIDSVGFQQPEIILSENLYEVDGADKRLQTGGLGYYFEGEDGYTIKWSAYSDLTRVPEPGMIIYLNKWKSNSAQEHRYEVIDEGPFLGKVVSVSEPKESGYLNISWYTVECAPIDNLSEVFEQLISVEQLGTDAEGQAHRRMAGQNKMMRRVSGNRDMTLVNLDGHFPFSRGDDTYSATLSLDLSLKVGAQVSYNISSKATYINVTLKEDAEVGVSFTAKYNIEEVTTWHLGGLPVYFPSILPIFQLDPSPEAFIKTTGDLSLKVSSPKYAYHGTQSFHLGTDGVSGSCKNDCPPPGSDDNGWSMELSLNGSLQAGSNFPMKLETNRWAEKAIYASVGADVYVGPKLSASFTLDPVALAKGDIYQSLGGTNITLAPMAVAFEANAEYSFRNKEKTKQKFFEGETSFFSRSLRLFPEFETTKITSQPEDGKGLGTVSASIFPRGYSVPYYVGVAAYNTKKELVSKTYYTPDESNQRMYGFFNTFDEMPCRELEIIDGTYSIVPIINAFGYDVPAWGAEVEVKRNLQPSLGWPQESAMEKDNDPTTGFVVVAGLLPDDVVDFEMVRSMTYTHERKETWRWIDRALNKYEHNIEYDNENTTEGAGGASFSEKGGYGGEYIDDTPTGVWWRLGPETAGARLFFVSNKCKSTSKQTGRYISDVYTWLTEEGSTYTYSCHYEACTYRAKITRKDGRIFYTDEFDLCGYGPHIKTDGTSYDQFSYPSGYSDNYVTFQY